MIDSSQISVIVQGNIVGDKDGPEERAITRICLNRIRVLLPQCEIILSTWAGSDLSGLIYDKVILNEDPGELFSGYDCNIIGLNLNRQIISTHAGLLQAERIFAVKMRTDSILENLNFLEYFYKYKKRSSEYRILEQRVVIPSLYTRDPKKLHPFPYHYGDTFLFGLTKDLLLIWDITTVQKCNYKDVVFDSDDIPEDMYYKNCIFRYIGEQYIYLNLLKKCTQLDIDFKYVNDMSNNNLMQSEKILVNNFIVLEPKKIGIRFTKFSIKFKEWFSVYSHNDWLLLYHKYCKGDASFKLFVAKLTYMLKKIYIKKV